MCVRKEKKGDGPKSCIGQIEVKEWVATPSTPTPPSPKQEALKATTYKKEDKAQESHNEAQLYDDK